LDRPITALTEGKIAIATSQGYFMELLCRYWKIRKPPSFQLTDFRGNARKELSRFSLNKIFSDFV